MHYMSCLPAVWFHFLQGQPPEPRSSHASTTLGHKGYICGGLVSHLNFDLSKIIFSVLLGRPWCRGDISYSVIYILLYYL